MSNYRKFLKFVGPLKKKLLLCLAFTVGLTVLGLTPPLLLKVLTDDVITAGNWGLMPMLIGLFIAVPLCRAVIGGFNTYVVSLAGMKLVFDLRLALYRRLQSLSMRFYSGMSTGAVMQRVMSDVNAVRRAVTTQTISLVTDGAACVFALSMCYWLNWRMAVVVTLILPFYVVNYRYFVRRIRDANVAHREKMDGICGILQERLDAPAMVKSFSREKDETRQFVEDTRETYDIARDSVMYSTSFSSVSNLLTGFGGTVVYCLGCYMVIQGQMGYGSVLAFCHFTYSLFNPAVRFSEIFNVFEQMKVSLDRIFELMDVEPDIVDCPAPVQAKRFDGRVTLEDVSFEYVPGEPVLQNIDIDVEPGKLVALVGHTGSGKTTIANLLFRFYDVTSGRILIDGHDIRDVRMADLRRNLGVVLQDTILFDEPIRDNIRYGKPDATDEAVIEAAKVAEVHSYVQSLPEGYDTLIGPGGVKLSVGQSQRIAIARAVLTDPSILVLDEATSALDTESEQLIQQALKRVMAGRTCFVIAHRLSTIVHSDMIVVLHEGRIIERGRHIDLLRQKGGHYRELCKEQFAAVAAEAGAARQARGQEAPQEAARARVRQTG